VSIEHLGVRACHWMVAPRQRSPTTLGIHISWIISWISIIHVHKWTGTFREALSDPIHPQQPGGTNLRSKNSARNRDPCPRVRLLPTTVGMYWYSAQRPQHPCLWMKMKLLRSTVHHPDTQDQKKKKKKKNPHKKKKKKKKKKPHL
jgi:hypothetical protein